MHLSPLARTVHILALITAVILVIVAHGRERFDGVSLLATWGACACCWGILGWRSVMRAERQSLSTAVETEGEAPLVIPRSRWSEVA